MPQDRNITKKVLALCFCLIVSFSKTQTHSKLSERCKFVIDSTYNALIKKYKVVGASLAIIDNGEIIYSAGYGFADREKKIKASDKTIYRIGSCSKSFTSLSILQLQEKKLLNINHSVKDYLPELNISSRFNDDNQIYINDMMCHVSGLPCDITNGFFCDAPPSAKWEIQQLNKQTTMSPRRYKHAYSNVAYGLLGEVIARTGNTTYANYLQQQVFIPLNMTSSFVDYEQKWENDFSKAYLNNKPIKEPLIRDAAAGLIHSNVLDMGNYLLMYLNNGLFNQNQIVSAESINDMQQNHLEDIYLYNNASWGYGLYTKKMYCKENKDSSVVNLIGHGGDTYAFHADFGYIPELKVGAVILTNTDNGTAINSVSKLLRTYLKTTYSKKLNYNYVDSLANNKARANDLSCYNFEKKGNYNMGEFIIKVNHTQKFKFKQGPATIVCTQKKSDTNNYTLKARLFGFVPIKIKDQELKFIKKGNDIYLKGVSTKSKEEDYIGIKSRSIAITKTWEKALGNYTVVGENYTCTDCVYMNSEGLKMQLKMKNGFMALETKAKSKDMNSTNYLDIDSDSLSVMGGIGRGTGEAVRILQNGNIYYSGFEFKKVD